MNYQIKQGLYTQELKNELIKRLNQFAIKATGIDGWDEEQVSFEAYSGTDFVGAVVLQIIYSQLHLKYLFVEEQYRHQGIGTALMQRAIDYGIEHGSSFVFLETLSYQAPEFYKKFGFELEFTRPGFDGGISFLYFKKNL